MPSLSLIPLGLRHMAVAAFFFSLMSLLVKISGRSLPVMEVVMARGVVSLVLAWGQMRAARIDPWGNRRALLALRGVLGFTGLVCYYYALTHLPLAEAVVIQNINPLLTAIVAAALLGERIGRLEVVCLVGGLTGVLLVAKPPFLFGDIDGGDRSAWAAAAAFVGAMTSSLAYVVVRKLGETEHALVTVFWFPLVAVPATVPLLWPVAVWPEGWQWLLLAGVGVSTHIAQIYMTRGLTLERAGRATAVSYLQIVFAGALGALFFQELPDALSLVGMALIIGCTLLVALRRPAAGGPPAGSIGGLGR